MATHAPTIENAICSKCGKQTKGTIIYEKELSTYSCNSCSKKSKEIDTKELIGRYARSRERIKQDLSKFLDKIFIERINLVELKKRLGSNKNNELLLKSRLDSIENFEKSIRTLFESTLNEDTLIPSEISEIKSS